MSRRRSSQLLINEPPLQVLPTLAVLIGLNEAIFLQQLHYWLQRSENERDGRFWVYNTMGQWQSQLPFWSVRTLERVVANLEKSGLVLSSNRYNKLKTDRTKWYTIDYDALEDSIPPDEGDAPRQTGRIQSARMAKSKPRKRGVHNDKTEDSVPETTQETTRRVPQTAEELDRWEDEQRRLHKLRRALQR